MVAMMFGVCCGLVRMHSTLHAHEEKALGTQYSPKANQNMVETVFHDRFIQPWSQASLFQAEPC